MSLTLVTAPAEFAVNPYRVKEHLRLDPQPQDDMLIEEFIEVAIARLDGRDGLLGRCLITQTWKSTLGFFPSQIVVPLPPCQSIDSITYIDKDDVEQTLPTADYQVFKLNSSGPALITPATGKSFPSTKSDHLEAVVVTFTAGYGDGIADIPQPIRQALAMDISHLDQNREILLVGGSINEIPFGYMDLLTNYRRWSF